RTVRLACAHGVAIGAHPGLPDLVGFGRRVLQIAPDALEDLVLYQIAAVAGVASAEGAALRHVKAHGALYHMTSEAPALAAAMARAIATFDRSLVVFAPPHSAMVQAAGDAGLTVAVEVFADRAYAPDGRLVDRKMAGAVIDDTDTVVERAVGMVRDRRVVAIDGSVLRFEPDTICLHGDTPGAHRTAAAVRRGLEGAGVRVKAVGQP
ncbi:MAG: 5-oxoprolinase subunit PxpA, partial [Acidobacteriota bacterium]